MLACFALACVRVCVCVCVDLTNFLLVCVAKFLDRGTSRISSQSNERAPNKPKRGKESQKQLALLDIFHSFVRSRCCAMDKYYTRSSAQVEDRFGQ